MTAHILDLLGDAGRLVLHRCRILRRGPLLNINVRVVVLMLGAHHLRRLHLDQALTRALLDLLVEHLRGDMHLLAHHLIACDSVIANSVGILLRRSAHVGALLWTRTHLLVMGQLADHSGALRCAEGAHVCCG